MTEILNYEALGKRIRMYRKALRLTQEALAEKVGISLSFLGHVERGSRKASLETLIGISKALDMTPNDILVDSMSWVGATQNTESVLLTQIHELIDNYLQDGG